MANEQYSVKIRDGRAVSGQYFPIAAYEPVPDIPHPRSAVFAEPTGEFRSPKRGEWYLSGAIVEAYRAPNDLDTPFHIAKLVVRVATRYEYQEVERVADA